MCRTLSGAEPGRQDRDVEAAQRPAVALVEARVGGDRGAGGDRGGGEGGVPAHGRRAYVRAAAGRRVRLGGVPDLKEQLRADLTTAMKARDELRTATLRMVLTAVTAEEVAGKEARVLSDDEVQAVLRREAKKRREAAEAFGARRPHRAGRAGAGRGRGARRLPARPARGRRPGRDRRRRHHPHRGVGHEGHGQGHGCGERVVAGRADGGRVAAEVRRQLG